MEQNDKKLRLAVHVHTTPYTAECVCTIASWQAAAAVSHSQQMLRLDLYIFELVAVRQKLKQIQPLAHTLTGTLQLGHRVSSAVHCYC